MDPDPVKFYQVATKYMSMIKKEIKYEWRRKVYFTKFLRSDYFLIVADFEVYFPET